MEDMKKGRITPSWIDSLKAYEILVFGSILAGMHGGGAARIARLLFGAVMGKGVGLQGQSYAIPTMAYEILVFGSILAGMHGGGAARIARLLFGAVMGKGVGLQGQSYAIPTMKGGVETIRPYVYRFIAYAKRHPEKHFLVTPIGCGIAGFEAEDIAPLFKPFVHTCTDSSPMPSDIPRSISW